MVVIVTIVTKEHNRYAIKVLVSNNNVQNLNPMKN